MSHGNAENARGMDKAELAFYREVKTAAEKAGLNPEQTSMAAFIASALAFNPQGWQFDTVTGEQIRDDAGRYNETGNTLGFMDDPAVWAFIEKRNAPAMAAE